MTDALKRELAQMLEEHKAILAAVENLRVAARAENAEKYERLVNDLALHAQTEKELLLSGHPRRRAHSRSTPPDIAVLDARRRPTDGPQTTEIHDVTASRSCRSHPGRLP